MVQVPSAAISSVPAGPDSSIDMFGFGGPRRGHEEECRLARVPPEVDVQSRRGRQARQCAQECALGGTGARQPSVVPEHAGQTLCGKRRKVQSCKLLLDLKVL